MDIEAIKARVRANQYVYTFHADIERKVDGLLFTQIEEALLNRVLLESYPDTGRGEGSRMVGVVNDIAVQVVCGWRCRRSHPIPTQLTSSPASLPRRPMSSPACCWMWRML
jgi:hypothetical protein